MNQQEIIEELIKRVKRLESGPPRQHNYNLQQAAERLNMSVSKLRQQLKQGRGPKGCHNGKIWNFTDQALENYLAAQAEEDEAA